MLHLLRLFAMLLVGRARAQVPTIANIPVNICPETHDKIIAALGSVDIAPEVRESLRGLVKSSALNVTYSNDSSVDSRRLFIDGKTKCTLLKATAEVASMVDSFCSGDISTIVDQFQEMLMGEVSEVTGTACDKIGDLGETELLKQCEDMSADGPVTGLAKEQCTSKGPDLIEKMVDECKKKADAQVEKFLDSAEQKATNEANRLKRKALKNKKIRRTAKKAKKVKHAACAAAPVIAGLAGTLHNSECKKVVTDLYIGCTDSNDMPAFKDTVLPGQQDVGTPDKYAYSADTIKGYLLLWMSMIGDQMIYMIKNGKGDYANPQWKQTYDQMHQIDPTDNAFKLAIISQLSEEYQSSLDTAVDDPTTETKLVSLKLVKKGAAADFCPYIYTTSFDMEMTYTQIIDQVQQTTTVDNVFYKKLTAEEYEKFDMAVEKSCKGKTAYNMWFQQSNAFASPLKFRSCISEVVTTEQDRYATDAAVSLNVAIACLLAFVASGVLWF